MIRNPDYLIGKTFSHLSFDQKSQICLLEESVVISVWHSWYFQDIENLTYVPDQQKEQEAMDSIVHELNKQITDMQRQIDDFKVNSERQRESLEKEEEEVGTFVY